MDRPRSLGLAGERGRRLATLRGHDSAVIMVRWSPGGGHLATACEDGTVRLWSFRPAPAADAGRAERAGLGQQQGEQDEDSASGDGTLRPLAVAYWRAQLGTDPAVEPPAKRPRPHEASLHRERLRQLQAEAAAERTKQRQAARAQALALAQAQAQQSSDVHPPAAPGAGPAHGQQQQQQQHAQAPGAPAKETIPRSASAPAQTGPAPTQPPSLPAPAEARFEPLPREQGERERAAVAAEAAVLREQEASHDLAEVMGALPGRPPEGREQGWWHCAASLQHRGRGVCKATSVGWSPCGRLLVTSGTDGRVLVWDVAEALLRSTRHRKAMQLGGLSQDSMGAFGGSGGGGLGGEDSVDSIAALGLAIPHGPGPGDRGGQGTAAGTTATVPPSLPGSQAPAVP